VRRTAEAQVPELRLRERARHKVAEFLYQEALYPEAEYAFKHPLTQEVLLGGYGS
jgi:hypothetical protein